VSKKKGATMKIGFVSMPFSGHLNPMTALARKLQSRGNEVVFFGFPDVEPFTRAAGLDFVPYGEAEFPVGSIDKFYSSVATMRGFEVVRHSCMNLNPHLTRVTFDYLAEKIATTGVEALVIDTIHFFIELVPLSMSIPYVHIWNVLHLDFSGQLRPLFSAPRLILLRRALSETLRIYIKWAPYLVRWRKSRGLTPKGSDSRSIGMILVRPFLSWQ
jgi:UDP:flavonoid glycosyltransferase YjiC (YdhE family)